jgi:uncharacterized protein
MSLGNLDHLPAVKRRELARAVEVLFDCFDKAMKSRLSTRDLPGRILKIILFGSYARGGWVEDRASGYSSDYDLLVVVNNPRFTDVPDYWSEAEAKFLHFQLLNSHIRTPVNFIVHDLADVNDQLARGRPFFSDIHRDGIVLYDVPGHLWAEPRPLDPEVIWEEAMDHYCQWLPLIWHAIKLAEASIENDVLRDAAFMLHQAAERAYHCILLVLTLYSPKSHWLPLLRSQAEGLDARLRSVWPRDTKLARQSFNQLRRAYVEARYSRQYTITDEQVAFLLERVKMLQELAVEICEERLEI